VCIYTGPKLSPENTINTLYYSSRIVFSQTPIEFSPTQNSAIRSAYPVNPTLEPNMEWIGWSVAEISPFLVKPEIVKRCTKLSVYIFVYTTVK